MNTSVQEKQNTDYFCTLSTVKCKHNIEDEDLAKILQNEYNKEDLDTSWIYDGESPITYYNTSDTEGDEPPGNSTYWEKLAPVLWEVDKDLSYKPKSKHDVKRSKKCKHIIPGVDPKAKVILNKMIEKGLFDKIDVVLFKGREFTILRATKKIFTSQYDIKMKTYAVKVFQTRQLTIDWSYDATKHEYVPSEMYRNTTKTNLAQSKAEKEMIYYQRLKMAGIPCPDVIALKQHVLVLSMVGDNSGAPMLRHAQMHRLKTEIPYEQVMQYMKILYKQCNLIHGNLTDKNILWFDSSCYLINLSRALEPHERNAYHFLFNDCKNICKVSNISTLKSIEVVYNFAILFSSSRN